MSRTINTLPLSSINTVKHLVADVPSLSIILIALFEQYAKLLCPITPCPVESSTPAEMNPHADGIAAAAPETVHRRFMSVFCRSIASSSDRLFSGKRQYRGVSARGGPIPGQISADAPGEAPFINYNENRQRGVTPRIVHEKRQELIAPAE